MEYCLRKGYNSSLEFSEVMTSCTRFHQIGPSNISSWGNEHFMNVKEK